VYVAPDTLDTTATMTRNHKGLVMDLTRLDVPCIDSVCRQLMTISSHICVLAHEKPPASILDNHDPAPGVFRATHYPRVFELQEKPTNHAEYVQSTQKLIPKQVAAKPQQTPSSNSYTREVILRDRKYANQMEIDMSTVSIPPPVRGDFDVEADYYRLKAQWYMRSMECDTD